MDSTRTLISKSFIPFIINLGIVPSAQIIIGITVIMFSISQEMFVTILIIHLFKLLPHCM